MNIGIIDADLISRKKHRFPNLACMKISGYYKKIGHSVSLLRSYNDVQNYDKIFISKVFTDTPVPDGITTLHHVRYGGTGFYYDHAAPLAPEIEHCMPDYHLYDEFVSDLLEKGVSKKELQYYTDFSIGFTTRGCIRGCSFCVNKNYRSCLLHSPVEEFLDHERKYICLLDDNVLSCKDWRIVFDQLNATGKRFQFKQGMDERLLTDEKCDAIFNSNWIGDYIFAFDNIKDRRLVERKLQTIRKHTDIIPKFYVFCGYNHADPGVYPVGFWENDIHDVFKRIKVLVSYRSLPYIMRYTDYKQSPYRGMYDTIARWCNQPSFIKKKSFREFVFNTPGQNKSAPVYFTEFERQHPEIATKYFDMKWSDFIEPRDNPTEPHHSGIM